MLFAILDQLCAIDPTDEAAISKLVREWCAEARKELINVASITCDLVAVFDDKVFMCVIDLLDPQSPNYEIGVNIECAVELYETAHMRI